MKNKTYSKLGKILGYLFLGFFFLFNIIAYNHAKKFTRYSEPSLEGRTKLDKLSNAQKAALIFSGINNPKPKNDSLPTLPYQTLKMGTDRKLEGWQIDTADAKGTVIVFHGYSSNKSAFTKHAELIHNMGWNVLLMDFYGCGGSDGYESTIGYNEAQDVITAFRYVDSLSEKPIVLYGSSMGSAAVMKAIVDNSVSPDKIILECPFGNMRSAVDARVKVIGAPSFPFTDLFMFWGGVLNNFWAYNHNPEEYATHIKVPTLLLYGEKDKRVPRTETDLIFKNLTGEKQLVTFPESGHENYLKKYKLEWTAAVAEFLN